jgi:hypothetical protein
MSEQWPNKEQEIWFQAGVTGERERIIKLLIDCHLIRKEGNSYFTGFNGDEDCTDVIELIKGEIK